MRKIKFRVWSKEGQDFLLWDQLLEASDLIDFLKHAALGHGEDGYYSELMQYTGFNDKNGKEIYEGDILGAGYYKYLVDYDEEWGFTFKDPGKRNWETNEFDLAQNMIFSEVEIIGNIHENPELIS
jgi:uncharacterized phage protein (TIGR01671 family)